MKKATPREDDEDLDGLDDDEAEAGDQARPAARRTLAQMAAETAAAAGEASGGVHCPKCGCRMSRVVETWDVLDGRRRKRVCRHCGRAWCTTEH